jgi:hypothetical protein
MDMVSNNEPKGKIELKNIVPNTNSIEYSEKQPLCFNIRLGSKVFNLKATTTEECFLWIKNIEKWIGYLSFIKNNGVNESNLK